MLYHWTSTLSPIFFFQERGKKLWNIGSCQEDIQDIREHLLFIHAWTGCNSTSAINGKGKPTFVNALLLRKSETLRVISETISDYWATHEEVTMSSVEAFQEIYGGNTNTPLAKLR